MPPLLYVLGAFAAGWLLGSRRRDEVGSYVVGQKPDRIYSDVSEGAFYGLLDRLAGAGVACSGAHPAECRGLGASFVVIHDPDDLIRVIVRDAPQGSGPLIAKLDAIMTDVPRTRTY
jgi:hypothetical protein